MIKEYKNRNFFLFLQVLLLTMSYLTLNTSIALSVENTNTNDIPEARFGHSIVYDSNNDKIFLFGGSCDDRYINSKNDLWTYDYITNNWTELTPSFSPAVRLNFAMSYDSDSQRIILFGGNSRTAGWELDDTWIYDYQTNTWSNVYPTNAPPGRSDAAIVYDPITKQTILFGGMRDIGDTTYLLNDTWAYDYETNTWVELEPTVAPQIRYGSRMIYNSVDEKIILYGGNTFGELGKDEKLWTFEATTSTWEVLDLCEESGPRYWYGLAYDSHQNELIAFGGTDLGPEIFQSNETWLYNFNSNQWAEVTKEIKPPACALQSMVYDQKNRRVVLFGGHTYDSGEIHGKVWIYDTDTEEWNDLEPDEIPEIPTSMTITTEIKTTDNQKSSISAQATRFDSMFLIFGFGFIVIDVFRRRSKF